MFGMEVVEQNETRSVLLTLYDLSDNLCPSEVGV
jgi:hypothetical protein